MDRYEIRPYGEKINRSSDNKKIKGKKPSQFYGVWDKERNEWVINAAGVGKQKAIKILKALTKKNKVDEIRPFWRE